MRIGFDAKRAFFNRSGLGNYSRDIIRSLRRKFPEHEYYLYTPRLRNRIPFMDEDEVNIVTPRRPVGKLRQSIWRSYQLAGRIRSDKLDVFHGLSNELPANLLRLRAKTVVTIHDLIFMRYPQWYPLIDRMIYQKKFRYSSEAADRVITVSEQTKNDLVRFFNTDPRKIDVIYQGCNSAFSQKLTGAERQVVREKWGLPSEYLLYVGTIEKRKNLLSILEAIHRNKISLPLVAIGRPTGYMKEVKAYIRKYRLKNIMFLSEIQVEDLPGIYQMASFFVYPSVFEGFGIPILEAMHSGIPVITSRGGCFSEVGGEAALYIDPSDPDELGSELSRLLNDPVLQKKMIETGHRQKEKFSNDNIALRIMNLYKGLTHA